MGGLTSFQIVLFFLRTFTLCLISSPDTHGRNLIFLADSAVRATHGVAIMTSEGAF